MGLAIHSNDSSFSGYVVGILDVKADHEPEKVKDVLQIGLHLSHSNHKSCDLHVFSAAS